MTSYGYDVRLDRKFKVFTNVWGAVVDPKNFDPRSFVEVEGDYCLIPPNSFVLAETVEYIEIPRDVLVVCVGKSTYRPMRADRERDPAGARVARPGDARDLEHDAAAGQALRERGDRPAPVLPGRGRRARRATRTRRASTRTSRG